MSSKTKEQKRARQTQADTDWVLQQRGDALAGWYYCGGGNPMTKSMGYAVGYKSRREARNKAHHLEMTKMGTFIPRKRAKELRVS